MTGRHIAGRVGPEVGQNLVMADQCCDLLAGNLSSRRVSMLVHRHATRLGMLVCRRAGVVIVLVR